MNKSSIWHITNVGIDLSYYILYAWSEHLLCLYVMLNMCKVANSRQRKLHYYKIVVLTIK